jgi:hypothetical protein
MQKKICILLFVFFTVNCNSLLAYDGKVHKRINEETASPSNSSLHDILMNKLGIAKGIEEKLKKGNEEKSILKWIAFGGAAEDYGKGKEGDKWYNIPSTRGYNHFHDPLKDWDEAGFNKPGLNETYWLFYKRYPISSILWGLDPGTQDFIENTTGDWSWGKAREYYYHALTKKTEEERSQNFADCFRALGQVMHLLQDASVPMHTRNDFHTPFYSNLETYTLKNVDFLNYAAHPPDPGLLQVPAIIQDPNYPDMVPVSGLFDRNAYSDPGPLPPSNILGLAEYSNANFLTLDTMWDYPHPNLDNDTNYLSIDWLHPETVIAENGKLYNRLYLKFKEGVGEDIAHLAAVDYYTKEYLSNIHMVVRGGFTLDEACWKDYAEKLIPRAVGYSAALLDYFFRGEMGVACLPIFFDNGIYALWVKIMNTTSTQESMSNGTFSLVCRYTPTGGSPDGTDDIFVQCSEVACDTLQHGDEYEALFFLSQSIPIEHYQSVRCMLAFQGSLGNESGAVVGKSFTLGEIKFNEEWDNGLDGNYPWTHTTADDNPPNGSTINTIENGILIKKNIRYEGNRTARYNTSFLYIPGSGVAITPSSYLQFKIDELSINEIPPAPEGYKTHDQELMLYFNDGDLNLQFSVDDQWVNLGWPNVGYYSFTPEAIMIDNIHQLFTNYGIAIPDPLYLNRIGFGQQLWNLDDPSTVEHTQTMRVDFIRVIEEKQEEGQQ